MATNTTLRCLKDIPLYLKIRLEHVRHGHHLRGKPPTIASSLKDRMQMLKKTDPTVSFQVNIGFSVQKVPLRKKQEWMSELKANKFNVDFERQIKNGKINLNIDEAKKIWLETCSAAHIHRIANHYGIYRDLYGDAFFLPVLPLDISFNVENDTYVKVCTGNVIKPKEASKMPDIKYDAEEDSLWTLVMSTPDGNLENSNIEYCHLFLGNIPGNKIDQAEKIIDYLKPFPAKGVGYYRYVFVLYKQNQRLDYTEHKRSKPCIQLHERNWNTLEFYRKYQADLTPAGLAFFQSDWDSTVKEFYHSTLNTKEPIFEYDFPKPHLNPQKWFPLKEPFNLYLDRYRDPKDVKKDFLLRKLQTTHPFKEPSPPLKYPNACRIDLKNVPSWAREQMQNERMGWGRINDIK